jgi:hypothetical protein
MLKNSAGSLSSLLETCKKEEKGAIISGQLRRINNNPIRNATGKFFVESGGHQIVFDIASILMVRFIITDILDENDLFRIFTHGPFCIGLSVHNCKVIWC